MLRLTLGLLPVAFTLPTASAFSSLAITGRWHGRETKPSIKGASGGPRLRDGPRLGLMSHQLRGYPVASAPEA
jgi:hypothetical protein